MADYDVIVPIAVGEAHEPVLAHADAFDQMHKRSSEEFANGWVSGAYFRMQVRRNLLVEETFIARSQHVLAGQPEQPHLHVTGPVDDWHGHAASHDAVRYGSIRLNFFQRVANDSPNNLRIAEDEG
jgi:hypothetical protein